MKIKPALLLYFISCAVFMLSVVIESSNLMLISKPVIVPSIFFYYLQERRFPVSWFYSSIIVLFFAGDMILLIDPNNYFPIIISMFLLGYLLYFKGIFDDFIRIRSHFLTKAHLLVLLICVFLLVFLQISIMDIVLESKTDYLWLLMVYGVVLVLIGFISSWNYIMYPSRYTTFMILTSLSFVISDVFYILKKESLGIDIFEYLNNLSQALSYYFLTKYFLLKKDKN
ncbi:MAG TPA: lysoplasmalogenase family protein [Flavobacterium sp.]|uniref:lysoplasmalogenase family protein n=1 Tax=Flavobacterium sp. TaxID=239 RepID=UPI002B63E8B7|nr:lysoplasmalogenase family protein [Flavobacterium sp.]HSD13985.1 lysoplasmalogenase family protein [Flavobacterium sp.]